ncbi:hypothetical protein COO60DRAFT_1481814, partial [Scenedesmus sp. NREL 46B-D3]
MASQQFVAQTEGYVRADSSCQWDARPKARSQQAPSCSRAGCDQLARQRAGGSPCSSSVSSDCAMELSQCQLSQQLQQQQQQSVQLNREDSGSCAEMDDGWFSKCRGCGCMTAHEQSINGADVPFCRRCQVTLDAACPDMHSKMVDTLLYVHQAWSD